MIEYIIEVISYRRNNEVGRYCVEFTVTNDAIAANIFNYAVLNCLFDGGADGAVANLKRAYDDTETFIATKEITSYQKALPLGVKLVFK